jgi:hypothetical protein
MATAHLQAQALTIRKYSAVEHTLFQNNALKRLLEPIRHLKRALLDIRAIFMHTATSMKQVIADFRGPVVQWVHSTMSVATEVVCVGSGFLCVVLVRGVRSWFWFEELGSGSGVGSRSGFCFFFVWFWFEEFGSGSWVRAVYACSVLVLV